MASRQLSANLTPLNNKPCYKINKHEARLLLLQGNSSADVARKLGVTPSAISQMFNGELEQIKEYLAFKQDPGTVYEYIESKIAANLTKAKIEKMSGYQSVGSCNLLRQTVRLERDQSTSNVSVLGIIADTTKALQGYQATLQALQEAKK